VVVIGKTDIGQQQEVSYGKWKKQHLTDFSFFAHVPDAPNFFNA